jgi:hypothetical protein
MRPDKSTLLGHHASVLALFSVSLLVTAGIVQYQTFLRSYFGDPDGLAIFYHLYLVQDHPAAWLGILLLFLGLVPAVQRMGFAISESLGANPVWAAILAGVALAAGAYWVYQAHPLCMDEYAPYLQSHVFAAGKLTGQLPPELIDWLVVPEFQGSFLYVSHDTGAVASAYMPGFALLLAPFSAFGVPWLANPVIGALSLFVIHRLALVLTGSAADAGAAMFFALASPVFTINAISFYSMPAHLLCNAIFVVMLLDPTPRRALAAGVVGGLALTLHNPAPHLLFAGPWFLWLMTRGNRWRLVASIFAGYMPWILVTGIGWQQLLGTLASTSDPNAAPVALSLLGHLAHVLGRVLVIPSEEIVTARLIGLSKVWLWAVPALVVVAALGFWRKRGDTHFRLLFASTGLTLVGYLFVPFDQGHGWGFRYFHSVWFVLPIFAVAALVRRPGAVVTVSSRGSRATLGYLHGTAVGSLMLLTLYFAWQVHSFIADHLGQLPRAPQGMPRVVIVDPSRGYYALDLVQNDPFMRGPVVTMVTHGAEQDQQVLRKYFPDLTLLAADHHGSVWGRSDGVHDSFGIDVRR